MLSWLQAIPFVHPALAGAALAAGLIPILVHLINRRRHRRVVWAAMSFLLAARRQSARQVRLQHWLLLLARVAVIVLIGLAIARPYLPASPVVALRSSRCHRVLLIDNSLSMSARARDVQTRFAVAQEYAHRLLASFPRGDAVSLVTLSAPAEAPIAHAAYDRRTVRDRLTAIAPTQREADPAKAIERAIEILRSSEMAPANRSVHVISDFRRSHWQGETEATPPPVVLAARRLADELSDSGSRLNLVRITSDSSENAALARLELASPFVAVGLPVRVTAEVANFGSLTARDLTLQFGRDGQAIRREPLPAIEPGKYVTVTAAVAVPSVGTHALEAKLTGPGPDNLPDDDTRYLSVELREATLVLVVDGRPGPTLLSGEAGFLATALTPPMPGRLPGEGLASRDRFSRPSPIDTKVITPAELAGEALPDYDVIALCNVPHLPPRQWQQLEEFTSRGGGLMVFAGDLLDTINYNRFGYADEAGLIPGRIGRLAAGLEEDAAPTGFKPERLAHPIVTEFAGHPESGLFLASVERYLPLELPAPRGEVVLRYLDGAPALVASAFGQGQVLFCTTTADMDWNNLPAKGDYVSLMYNAVAFLARRHGDHRNVLVGDTIREPLAPGQGSLPLRVRDRAGQTTDGRIVPSGEALALTHGPVERSGVLTVSIGAEVRSFAVNLASEGSDIRSVDEETLLRLLERPVRLSTDATSIAETSLPGGSAELASLTLYMVLVLLLVEMSLAVWFGTHSRGRNEVGGGAGRGLEGLR